MAGKVLSLRLDGRWQGRSYVWDWMAGSRKDTIVEPG